MKSRQPEVFFIAPVFFPYLGVGSLRAIKFCKYLPAFGFQPVVFTQKEDITADSDHSLEEDIRGLPIIRIPRLLPQRFVKGLDWVVILFFQIIRQARIRKPRAMIFTGSPFSAFLIAPLLKKIMGIPYILDFRDPWTVVREGKGISNRTANYLRFRVEGWSIKNAGAVIFVNGRINEMYRKHYSWWPLVRVEIIENGFDPEDLSRIPKTRMLPEDSVNIVYAGKLRVRTGGFKLRRDPTGFFRALKEEAERIQSSGKRVMFHYVGKADQELEETIEKFGVRELVRLWGPRPYFQTLQILRDADLTLLFGSGYSWESTTKVYEYIFLKNKVLMIGEGNEEVGNLIKNYQHGMIVQREQNQEIRSALAGILSDHPAVKEGRVVPEVFSRKELTGKLAKAIGQLWSKQKDG